MLGSRHEGHSYKATALTGSYLASVAELPVCGVVCAKHRHCAFEAFVLKVLISSPGDTGEEVAAVKESLHGWNGSRAESAQVILLPRHWKSDAVPRLGAGGGQGVINEQLVDDADIVIALFDSRLGQATADAVSGTAEEIQRAVDAGKHVHVWFSNEPIGPWRRP